MSMQFLSIKEVAKKRDESLIKGKVSGRMILMVEHPIHAVLPFFLPIRGLKKYDNSQNIYLYVKSSNIGML